MRAELGAMLLLAFASSSNAFDPSALLRPCLHQRCLSPDVIIRALQYSEARLCKPCALHARSGTRLLSTLRMAAPWEKQWGEGKNVEKGLRQDRDQLLMGRRLDKGRGPASGYGGADA